LRADEHAYSYGRGDVHAATHRLAYGYFSGGEHAERHRYRDSGYVHPYDPGDVNHDRYGYGPANRHARLWRDRYANINRLPDPVHGCACRLYFLHVYQVPGL
jgi:hypothetical protein